MKRKTPLYDCHLAAGGKMVDFAGWQMPLHYGSQLQEHQYIREKVGMFDVSHMAVVDINGESATDLLRFIFANDVAKLSDKKALYTCMLNEQGGVLDDMIIYRISEQCYRIVLNASMRDEDIAWIQSQAENYAVEIVERSDVGILALQGPQAIEKISALFSTELCQEILDLKPFCFVEADGGLVARTGYTGEDGYEMILPAANMVDYWQKLMDKGVAPCGLGARDTLRLEAGLNLYGSDMNAQTTPLDSNLAWTVAFEPQSRDFLGRKALESIKAVGVEKRLMGLVLTGRQGILRSHQSVIVDAVGEGEITSGGFSPTLNCSIALARLPAATVLGQICQVEIRGKWIEAKVVKPPFVRFGKLAYPEYCINLENVARQSR